MRLGAHVSVAGGIHNALNRGSQHFCESIQIFTCNPRSWVSPKQSDEAISAFLEKREELRQSSKTDIFPVISHMPYLPNLATADPAMWKKSRASLLDNLERCSTLGIEYLVVHMGKHGGKGLDYALKRMANGINGVLDEYQGPTVLLLENTAGQGSETGLNMSEIGRQLDLLKQPKRVGVCLDTCHLFAAGYDLTSQHGMDALVREIDTSFGREKIKALHINDCKKELGSRVDRHEHIGHGNIGDKGFRLVLSHPAFKDLPGILETPQKEDGDLDMNLNRLRMLSRRKPR
jgi:deoxyribonuclease IV